jgi:VWFA-related protein
MRRLILAAALIGPVAATAETQKPAPPSFGSELSVMSLPVFVTDKDGKAVSGLASEDFEILDEGRAARIVGFQEIDAAQPLPLAARTFRGAAATRRQFLLLFDLSFTSVSGLVRCRAAASHFVQSQLGPNDLAAVATISVNSGLKLLVGFTADRLQLQHAVDGLGILDLDRRPDPLGLAYDASLMQPQLAQAPAASGGGKPSDEAKSDREERIAEQLRDMQRLMKRGDTADYRRKVSGLLKGIYQLGQMLDAVQGRKQVIFLSAGFDDTTLVGEQGAQARRNSEAIVEGRIWEVQSDERFGDAGIRQQMDQMLRGLASGDVVVHTVDVTGLSTSGDVSTFDGAAAPRGGRESLSQIAQGSGGLFFKDMNDLGRVFGSILDATQRYYVVAFELEAKGPGKFHKLKVRVKGKDRSVSTRAGYLEPDAAAAKSPARASLQAAEAIVKGISGGDIDVRVLAVPYRSAEGRVTLLVVLEVNGRALLEGHGAGGNLGLQIFGYAMDEQGHVEDTVALAPTLDLGKVGPRLLEQGLQLHTAFTLSPGRHSLRFLVRDGEKGRRGFQAVDATVPNFEDGAFLLSPPLFMDDPTHWVLLQSPSRSTATLELPFHVESDLFAPRARPQLANGHTANVCVLAYNGGASYAPGTQFEIKAQLLDADGTAVRFGKLQVAKVVADSDGYRRFVLNVTPGDVPPGDYSFHVKIKDPASGELIESAEPVRVN